MLQPVFDHLALIEHQFFSGIRDLRKAGSLWGMMRVVGGVTESIHQSWLAKRFGLGLVLLCWGFKRIQEEVPSEEASHTSILLADYLAKMGIKTVPHSPYSLDLAPSDFWLFPKHRGCRYETIEEMKESVTRGIDTLTQDDSDGAFKKLLEQYNKCIAAGGDDFEGD